jgi:hypothetical protein
MQKMVSFMSFLQATAMPPIRKKGWTCVILARDRHAITYAKMDGLMPI